MTLFERKHPQVLILNRTEQVGIVGSLSTQTFPQRLDVNNVRVDEGPLLFYRSIIAKGNNATTYLEGTKFKFSNVTPGVSRTVFPGPPFVNPPDVYTEITTGFSQGFLARPAHLDISSISAAVTSKAYSRFVSAVKKLQQQVSGPTFLGELREVIGMFRKPMKSFVNLVNGFMKLVRSNKSYRRGLRYAGDSQEFARVLSDSWLELKFGLLPLISDIKGIAEGLARLLLEDRHSVVRGFAEDTVSQQTASEFLTTSNTLCKHITNVRTTFQHIFRGGVRASLTDTPLSTVQEISRVFGFTLNEFIPTAWELLPFSFLIDYVSNVGDVIASAMADFSDISWSCETTRLETIWEAVSSSRIVPERAQFGYMNGNSMGSLTCSLTSVTRSPANLYNRLGLAFSLPGGINPYANFIALLHAWSH